MLSSSKVLRRSHRAFAASAATMARPASAGALRAIRTAAFASPQSAVAHRRAVGGVGAVRMMATDANAPYKNIIVERKEEEKVLIITLNRPKALNALNSGLMSELIDALEKADANPQVSCIVLTGGDKAFAAGADIKEMASKSFIDCYKENFAATWQAVSRTRKPIVAAVNGFCLGGGCEVAMMADIMYAGDNAKFAQPEITLGTIPGAGGTQRLVRQIGKSRAMELCLTGEMMGADEALRLGLVSKVFPAAETIPEAIKTAGKIASMSQMSVEMCKEAINQSYETGLQQGLVHESRAFWSTFATKDQKEGMGAFVEKRKPDFKDC